MRFGFQLHCTWEGQSKRERERDFLLFHIFVLSSVSHWKCEEEEVLEGSLILISILNFFFKKKEERERERVCVKKEKETEDSLWSEGFLFWSSIWAFPAFFYWFHFLGGFSFGGFHLQGFSFQLIYSKHLVSGFLGIFLGGFGNWGDPGFLFLVEEEWRFLVSLEAFWFLGCVWGDFWEFCVEEEVMSGGGGGGAAPAPKADDLQPHPVKDQLPNVSYCITSPPPWREYFISPFYLLFFFF